MNGWKCLFVADCIARIDNRALHLMLFNIQARLSVLEFNSCA